MPRMVAFFSILVVPLGGFLLHHCPVLIGTYCTLCLIAAAAMLIMIPLTLDEVGAMGRPWLLGGANAMVVLGAVPLGLNLARSQRSTDNYGARDRYVF